MKDSSLSKATKGVSDGIGLTASNCSKNYNLLDPSTVQQYKEQFAQAAEPQIADRQDIFIKKQLKQFIPSNKNIDVTEVKSSVKGTVACLSSPDSPPVPDFNSNSTLSSTDLEPKNS